MADSDDWEIVDTALASLAADWVTLDSGSSEPVAVGEGPATGWQDVAAPHMAELRRAYSNGGAAGVADATGATNTACDGGAAEMSESMEDVASPDREDDSEGLDLLKALSSFDAAAALAAVDGARSQEVNCRDTGSWTLLHWAAFRGHTEACANLLRRPDFKVANYKAQWLWGGGYTALHLAAAKGHTEACEAILASPTFKEATTKRGGRTAVDFARQFRHAATANAIQAALAGK